MNLLLRVRYLPKTVRNDVNHVFVSAVLGAGLLAEQVEIPSEFVMWRSGRRGRFKGAARNSKAAGSTTQVINRKWNECSARQCDRLAGRLRQSPLCPSGSERNSRDTSPVLRNHESASGKLSGVLYPSTLLSPVNGARISFLSDPWLPGGSRGKYSTSPG